MGSSESKRRHALSNALIRNHYHGMTPLQITNILADSKKEIVLMITQQDKCGKLRQHTVKAVRFASLDAAFRRVRNSILLTRDLLSFSRKRPVAVEGEVLDTGLNVLFCASKSATTRLRFTVFNITHAQSCAVVDHFGRWCQYFEAKRTQLKSEKLDEWVKL